MLRGLPFSNVLGLWSGHPCSSSPGSDTPRGSCSCTSSCSPGPTSFSCEPVWCMCAREWSARCPGCNAHAREYQMTMTWCIHGLDGHLQGSQHHPRACKNTKHLIPSFLQIVPKCNQQTHKMLQIYTKPPFILLNPYITIHRFFSHF